MEEITTRGIIIKRGEYGEGHILLAIFTQKLGIVRAVSYGAKKSSKSKSAESQLLYYGDFTLKKRADMYVVAAVNPAEGFYPIYEDIKKLSLTAYFGDILTAALDYENPDEDVLRLFLNTVYALAYKGLPPEKAKPVFELRLMCECGYMPLTGECIVCGGEEELMYFAPVEGGVLCRSCGNKSMALLNSNVYNAMVYITECDDRKIFSFKMADADMAALDKITERYVEVILERRFNSLDYYKKI